MKTSKDKRNDLGKVFHYDLFGLREIKYNFLCRNSLQTVDFKELKKAKPYFFFVPKDYNIQTIYNNGFAVDDLFIINGTGIVTKRDNLCIGYTEELCFNGAKDILTLPKSEFYLKYHLPEDVRDWRYEWALKDIQDHQLSNSYVKKIVYRPFDKRFVYYTGQSRGFMGWPVVKVMQHFLSGKNVGLIIPKQVPDQENSGGFITTSICAHKSFSAYNINNVFPLYLYSQKAGENILNERTDRTPNLSFAIIRSISDKTGLAFISEKENKVNTFAPIDILDFIYAILNSPTYRDKYREFLKSDFPRIPYPKDKTTFWHLVKFGGELRQIHLLESPIVSKFITTYPVKGSNEVGKVIYSDGKVRINSDQYFDKVPLVAWEFYIGGYQPAQKWLKDRKGRTLSFDDIQHYQKIIVALSETDRIMKEIDLIDFM